MDIGPSTAAAGPSTAAAGWSAMVAQSAAAAIVQSVMPAVAQSPVALMDIDNNSCTLLSPRVFNSRKRLYFAISPDAPSPSISLIPSEAPASDSSCSKLQKGSHVSDPYPLGSRTSQALQQNSWSSKASKVTQAATEAAAMWWECNHKLFDLQMFSKKA